MTRTVAYYHLEGTSKAKTSQAILFQNQETGLEAWFPLRIVEHRFIGPNYRVRVSVPDWLLRKVDWKQPTEKPVKAAAPVETNPYVGMDFGNMMEEQMVLSEVLSHTEIEYSRAMDACDDALIVKLNEEITKIKKTLVLIADAMKVALKV